jgi:HSP20 family protein
MASARWTPMRNLASFQDEMNRMFQEFFQGGTGEEAEWRLRTWAPSVDIYETDDALVLKAELPGVSKDDVSIEIHQNTLILRGERKRESLEASLPPGDTTTDAPPPIKQYYRIERAYGTFQRSFVLPITVDQEKVMASFKDGVLELWLPKTEAVRPKRIAVSDAFPEIPSTGTEETLSTGTDLSAAVQALTQATQALTTTATQLIQMMAALSPGGFGRAGRGGIPRGGTDVKVVEAYAIARLKNHPADQPLYVAQSYILEAGVQSRKPVGFEATAFILPSNEENIMFEVAVYADDMEIQPIWIQSYPFRRHEESPLLEFTLMPTEQGRKKIRIDFLHQQHWLAKIQFEVNVAPLEKNTLALPLRAEY